MLSGWKKHDRGSVAKPVREFWPSYRRWSRKRRSRRAPNTAVRAGARKHSAGNAAPTSRRSPNSLGGATCEGPAPCAFLPPPYVRDFAAGLGPASADDLVRTTTIPRHTLCEGVILNEDWNGREVIAFSDEGGACLDGINDRMVRGRDACRLAVRQESANVLACSTGLRYAGHTPPGTVTDEACAALARVRCI